MPNQTGPRTPEGKQASSQNHRQHGLATANIIVPQEERSYFDQIEAELRDEIKPDGPLEAIAFRRLLTANWQMEKCQQNEAVLIAEEPNEQNKANLEKVRRYYQRWEGSYNSAFRQIRLLQTDRGCHAYVTGDAPDSFAPLADLPKIEQYARRIASHKSFEAKIFDVVAHKLAEQEKRPSRTKPATPAQPSKSTLCDTKSGQQPEAGLGRRTCGEVGRNSPCPCGSGRKFKRCCGVEAPPILNQSSRNSTTETLVRG